MRWTNTNYYKAYDHNYRTAYAAGESTLGSADQRKAFRRLAALLRKTGIQAKGTRLLDLGCGEGDNGLFLSKLGYEYTGMDISSAAIYTARRRAVEAGVKAKFRVGDVLNLRRFPRGTFDIILDSYCFHMLILDSHREQYFQNVRKRMAKGGILVMLVQRDDSSPEGPFDSFQDFCRKTGTNPKGVPFQKCENGEWKHRKGKRVYLMGRARSLVAYKKEFTKAGFRVVISTSWQMKAKAAFVLQR